VTANDNFKDIMSFLLVVFQLLVLNYSKHFTMSKVGRRNAS